MFAKCFAKPKSSQPRRPPIPVRRPGEAAVTRAHLLQRTIGNQPMLQRASVTPAPLQAKLRIGAAHDPLEREADRVADQVLRMPAPGVAAAVAPPQLSRKCAECEEEEKLQRKSAAPQAAPKAPAIVHDVLRSPGRPLDSATRAFFEPRFGHDFSGVRVHADGQADVAARSVDALAFAVGRDVVFGAGHYRPDTDAGRRLLAHELVHVNQQNAGRTSVALQRQERKPWSDRRGDQIVYRTSKEAQDQINFILKLDGIEVDAPVSVGTDRWTFYYSPLTQPEAEAAKTAAEAALGKKDVFTVEFSKRAKSHYIQPKCPGAVPDEAGWNLWTVCFPTQKKATAQETKLKHAHIEAKTGKLRDGQFYVMFKPLTQAEAKAKGQADAEAAKSTRGGIVFNAKTRNAPELGGWTYDLESACPPGFQALGKFKITSYFIANEYHFPATPLARPCNLKNRTFRERFLYETTKHPYGVQMEGSGWTLSKDYINVTGEKERGKPCFSKESHPLGVAKRPLSVGKSVAVDTKMITIGTELLIEDVGSQIADDTGKKIKNKQIDEFKGPLGKGKNTTLEGKLVCKK